MIHIVGASLAGLSAARALRRHGFDRVALAKPQQFDDLDLDLDLLTGVGVVGLNRSRHPMIYKAMIHDGVSFADAVAAV